MNPFVVISYGLCFVIATVVGLRLLRIAARTRKAPELGIGLTVFTLGFGTAGMMGGQILAAKGQVGVGQGLAMTGLALVAVGAVGLLLALRALFRPNSPWATLTALCGCGVLVAAFGWRVILGGTPTPWDPLVVNGVFLFGRAFVYVWGAIESFRYAALLRRRLELGLAEPMALMQLRCWAIASTCMAISVATIAYGTFVLGAQPATWPAGIFVVSAVSLVACMAIGCAFMCPAWLRKRVEARRREVEEG